MKADNCARLFDAECSLVQSADKADYQLDVPNEMRASIYCSCLYHVLCDAAASNSQLCEATFVRAGGGERTCIAPKVGGGVNVSTFFPT
jgi:hypothetical protein